MNGQVQVGSHVFYGEPVLMADPVQVEDFDDQKESTMIEEKKQAGREARRLR